MHLNTSFHKRPLDGSLDVIIIRNGNNFPLWPLKNDSFTTNRIPWVHQIGPDPTPSTRSGSPLGGRWAWCAIPVPGGPCRRERPTTPSSRSTKTHLPFHSSAKVDTQQRGWRLPGDYRIGFLGWADVWRRSIILDMSLDFIRFLPWVLSPVAVRQPIRPKLFIPRSTILRIIWRLISPLHKIKEMWFWGWWLAPCYQLSFIHVGLDGNVAPLKVAERYCNN